MERRHKAGTCVCVGVVCTPPFIRPYWDGCRGRILGTTWRPYGGNCGSVNLVLLEGNNENKTQRVIGVMGFMGRQSRIETYHKEGLKCSLYHY